MVFFIATLHRLFADAKALPKGPLKTSVYAVSINIVHPNTNLIKEFRQGQRTMIVLGNIPRGDASHFVHVAEIAEE
jgi:hypothetical protein